MSWGIGRRVTRKKTHTHSILLHLIKKAFAWLHTCWLQLKSAPNKGGVDESFTHSLLNETTKRDEDSCMKLMVFPPKACALNSRNRVEVWKLFLWHIFPFLTSRNGAKHYVFFRWKWSRDEAPVASLRIPYNFLALSG